MILTFWLQGQCLSGKNNMRVDPRTGRHYPQARWATWRDEAVRQVRTYLHGLPKADRDMLPLTVPCQCSLTYYHADRRRRDLPGLRDALYHVFERAGVVKDDSLFVAEEGDTGTIRPSEPCVQVRIETEFVRTL